MWPWHGIATKGTEYRKLAMTLIMTFLSNQSSGTVGTNQSKAYKQSSLSYLTLTDGSDLDRMVRTSDMALQ